MTAVIEKFGALGVFLLMVPESACVPIPSEVTLLFAGFAVGQGWMSFPLAALAATAGNILGSLLAYALGASGLLASVPGARAAVRRGERLLDRYGTRAVFTARLLPLARTFISLPAGARHVPVLRFLSLTAAGCAIWAVGLLLAGVLAGGAWATVNSLIGRGLLVAVALTIAVWLWRARPRC